MSKQAREIILVLITFGFLLLLFTQVKPGADHSLLAVLGIVGTATTSYIRGRWRI